MSDRPDSSELAAVMALLEAGPAMLERFIAKIPPDRIDLVRRPGFWSIRDHVLHLAEVQPMLYERLRRFRDEEHPQFIPYLPSDEESRGEDAAADASHAPSDIDEAISVFTEWRGRQIELVRSYGGEVWSREGTHPEFDRYSALILVRHVAMHDSWHMYRIEELWITRDAFLTTVE